MKWKACDEEGRRTCYSSLLFLLNEEQMEPVTRGIFRDEMEEWGIKNRNTDGGVVPSIRPTCPKMQLSRHKKEEEVIVNIYLQFFFLVIYFYVKLSSMAL